MSNKTVISVIDQDIDRATSLLSELQALEGVRAVMSNAYQKGGASAGLTDAAAAFVGLSPDAGTTDTLIGRLLKEHPALPIVVFGQQAGIERRSRAHASALLDTLELPVSRNKLKELLARIRQPASGKAPTPRANHLFRSLVGRSAVIVQIQKLIDHVAITDSTVLITGESGTGKEVVARNIHYRSNRRGGPFVPINCAAIPDDLFESELFGHEKGAYTGAIATRKGRFELANKGTLFLDEIGDMPLGTQTKLLRVIQERVFERLGSNESIKADVRIVAATHCDLEKRIGEKRFRKDLFYRLNVFPIEMPSLRQRAEDIPLLIEELRQRLKHDLQLDVDFRDDALNCLKSNPWDGNVRELANVVERIAILYPGGKVGVSDLPHDLRSEKNDSQETMAASNTITENVDNNIDLSLPPDGLDLKHQLGDIEQRFIDLALEASDGVVSQAADLLRMRRTTLVEKIRRYSLASRAGANPTTAQHP